MKITDTGFTAFDLESTGKDPETARVVQFGAAVYEGRGGVKRGSALIDPGVPIPDEARGIHGIGDEDVRGKPTLARLAARVTGALDAAPLIVTFNGLRYDIPLLHNELRRAGNDWSVDEMKVLDLKYFVDWRHRGERPRTLEAIAPGVYGVEAVGGGAHRADVDAQMTGDMLLAMIEQGTVPDDVAEALRLCAHYREEVESEFEVYSYWLYQCRETSLMRMGAGKHCGTSIVDVPKGSLSYLLNKVSDLPPRVREIFEAVRDGRYEAVAQRSMISEPEPEPESEPGWGGWDD